MKILFFLLCYCMTLPSMFAQPFLEIGNQWILEHKKFVSPNTVYYQKTDSISITKDTLINDKNYLKLEATVQDLCGIFDRIEFLREDGPKIYRLSKNFETEYLMIDFSEDSSFQILTESNGDLITSEVVFDSMGTTVFPSGHELTTKHVRILNNQSYSDETPYGIYEHIGYLNPGFLFPDIGTGLCDPSFQSMEYKCFISGTDTIRLTESDCFSYDVIDPVKELNKESVPIFPNPTMGHVSIPEEYSLKAIYNLGGELVFENIDLQYQDFKITLPGTYIFVLEHKTEKSLRTQIVLKQ